MTNLLPHNSVDRHIVTTLALCWVIKTRYNSVLRFTDHDCDIEVDGNVYSANSGIDSSVIANSSAMIPDNFELEGIINNTAIKESDLLAGKYDHAEVVTFFIDYSNPKEKIYLKRGWLGEVRISGGIFFVEVKGLLQSLEKSIGSLYSSNCRAKFGDVKCGVDLNLYKYEGEVEQVIAQNIFVINSVIPKNIMFAQGMVIFKSGLNEGYETELESVSDRTMKLVLEAPMQILKGDKIEFFAGCNNNFSTCCDRYNNAINFRGEPDISC